MDALEIFYTNSIFLAEIEKNLDFFGHISMKQIFYKILNLTKKVRKWHFWSEKQNTRIKVKISRLGIRS